MRYYFDFVVGIYRIFDRQTGDKVATALTHDYAVLITDKLNS